MSASSCRIWWTSPSPTGKEIGVAHYLVERMRRCGIDTDLPLVDEGRPNAVGHLRGRGDGLNLLFTGHMDTSYSGDEEHLAGEGFKPKAVFRDGWIFGLGANNMKSGLAAALVAIEAIVKAGIELAGDISFGGVVGEIEKSAIEEFQGLEYSGYGIGTRHLVTHGVTADFALLAEPTGMRISIANMGCIWLRITVAGTVAHSALANKPNVVNAIAVMHELQNDIARWARDYEAAHVYMGERPECDDRGDPRRRALAAVAQPAFLQPLSRHPHRAGPDRRRRQARPAARAARLREAHRHARAGLACLCQRSARPCWTRRCRSSRRSAAAQAAVTGERPAADHPAARRRRRASHRLWGALRRLRSGRAACIRTPRGASMHAFGEHVLVDDCVAAARIYLAMALDLCSRKAP